MSAALKAVESEDPVSEPDHIENLKIATYAETGGRKTLQIGHLIERFGSDNVGIISAEHGLGTIASLVMKDQVQEVTSMAELRSAYMWAKQKYTGRDQWVCVDGGSRVLQWIRDDIFVNVQRAYDAILDGTKPQDLDASIRPYARFVTARGEVDTMQIWIRTGMETERLLNSFVRLNCSIYWTFWQEQTNVDQYTKGLPWKPDTPGKGPLDAVKSAFDFIMRLVRDPSDPEKTVAQCSDSSKVYYAKHRDDWRAGIKVPDEIRDFNLADFVERVRGKGFGA